MAPSPFPGFCSVPQRSVSQVAAMGAAALTLAGGAADATPTQVAPDPQPPSWTVAEAVASAPRSGALPLPSAVPTAPVATMAPVLGTVGATARWATVVGQVQPQTSAQCCFSEAAGTVRFRPQPSNSLQFSNEPEAISTHQFYLLLALTLWFGATAPWILRQFWLSQQRMSRRKYGRYAVRSRAQAVKASRHTQRTGLYQSKHDQSKRYRAIALDSTRATAQRFAKPRVATAAQHWSEEEVYVACERPDTFVYEALPSASMGDRTSQPEQGAEVQPVTELYPVAV